MANETVITVIGNLTADPELRYTPAGTSVANFSVASTPRHFNANSNDWEDGDTIFMRCTLWGEQAEHFANSASKGTRVVVYGKLESKVWEDKEGNRRTNLELTVDDIGLSTKFTPYEILAADVAVEEPTKLATKASAKRAPAKARR